MIKKPSPPLDRLTVRTVAETSSDDTVAALNAGFAGYVIPFSMTRPQYEARFRAEDLDPFASHIWSLDDRPAAILLIARRGWTSRVAAVGVSAEMRGIGLGAETMRRAVAEARARGDARLVLEVIETNAVAVQLYRRAGFAEARRLRGFSFAADAAMPDGPVSLQEIDPARGAARAARFGQEDLPWQLEPATLAAAVRPARCFVDAHDAIVAHVDASQETVRLRSIAFDAGLTPGDAARFTTALRAAFPGRPLHAPQIFPERHGTAFFEPGGWKPVELFQFEMHHPLGND